LGQYAGSIGALPRPGVPAAAGRTLWTLPMAAASVKASAR
jgi:hypothetical protein